MLVPCFAHKYEYAYFMDRLKKNRTMSQDNGQIVYCTVSSPSVPPLDLQRPIMDITKQNPFSVSEIFPNFYFLLADILRHFLGSYQSSSVNVCFPISSVLFYSIFFCGTCSSTIILLFLLRPETVVVTKHISVISVLSSALLTACISLP
jgi:hypothetical protein